MDGVYRNYNYIIIATIIIIFILGILWYFYIFLNNSDVSSVLEQMKMLSSQSKTVTDK